MSDIISRDFMNTYSGKKVPFGFNGLGYIVYKRTYSRLMDDGNYEEWPDTIRRCINGAQEIGAAYTQEEAERLFDHMYNLRGSFGGRMLWQLGTETVRRFGGNSLLNCWFTTIKEPEDFCFIFDNLMLGGGVGFSVRREDIHELPKIHEGVVVTHELTKDADFIVPDSREGWTELLRKTLNAFFETGKSFTYSTILVRGSGEPIRTFGGTASGPGILLEGIANITKVIKARCGKKLRSVDVLDICNIIGTVVVSGNVRRSAQIALGDPDDFLFIRAKRWDLGNIPTWRGASNNTIYADSYDHILERVWDGYAGNGEPYGFFNMPLAQKFGRIGEKKKDLCEGMNPCGEITMFSKECCNLVEHFLNNYNTKEEMFDCAKLLYKSQKAIAALPFLHEQTNEVVHKNMRLGQGVTGICQSMDKLDWLDEVYTGLRDFDVQWSEKMGYPVSIKLTTIKPSGCGVISTSLKTHMGDMTYEGIFKFYDIDITNYDTGLSGVWFDLSNHTNRIKVLDKNNNKKDITKLFINGIDDVYEFTTEDNETHRFTSDHLFLINRSDSEEWVKVKDLKENDDIVCWN